MSAERRYRLLLLSYPRSYRAERAGEMLDVLLAAEGRRGSWSGLAEAVSLVGHGVATRLSRRVVGPALSPSVGLAGVSLLCLLAILGAQQLAASGIRGLGLDGYPDEWQMGVLWVDPRWPVQALWVATGVALLLGRHRLAVASAWAAAALSTWHLIVTAVTTVELPWPGDVGPHWVASGGMAQGSWALLSVSGAVMLGRPAVTARARASLPGRGWCTVVTTGLVGVALASVAGSAAYALRGTAHPQLVEELRGPVVPLVLAAAVLASNLLRVPHGRSALLMLGLLAAAPLGARWSEPMETFGAGVVVFTAGYALAQRRSRRAVSAPHPL